MNESDLKRFMDKVDVLDSGCWYWKAYKDKDGYGRFQLQGKTRRAAVVAFEHVNGPVRPGLQVRHKCDYKPCVNWDHLHDGTQSDNTQDRVSKITHCPRNHPYDDKNTYRHPDGRRACKTCDREAHRAQTT